MARLNIEDKLFKDGRFTELCIVLGSRRAAIGALVEAWMLAQQQVSPNNPTGLVSVAEWTEQNIAPEIIQCRLAKIIGEDVEIVGGKENFSWLVQRQVAGSTGGRKKAESRSDLNKPPTEEPTASDRLAEDSGAKRAVPSYSSSLLFPLSSFSTSDSVSDSDSKNKNNSKVSDDAPKKPKITKEETAANAKIWTEYFNAYRLRYGIDALRNATVNSQISSLRKKLGTEDAIKVVNFYVKHNEFKYVKNTHTLGICLIDAETLRTQMLRGKPITTTMVRDFEKAVHNKERDEQIENMYKEQK